MEVVLSVSILSQAAVVLLCKRLLKAPSTQSSAIEEHSSSVTAHASSAEGASESATTEAAEASSSADEDARERELELRLASLRAAARAAQAPDTLVEYARHSRAANKVEKELLALREARASEEQGEGLGLGLLTSLFSLSGLSGNGNGGGLGGVARRAAYARMAQTVIGFGTMFVLWAYFRTRVADNGGLSEDVLVIECDVLRPFTRFLATMRPICENGDGTCAATRMCAISYRAVAFFANAVAGRILHAVLG